MTTTEYTVTGMSCGHCEAAIRAELAGITGIVDIDVSAADGHLSITSDTPLDDAAIREAVDEAGYTAVLAA